MPNRVNRPTKESPEEQAEEVRLAVRRQKGIATRRPCALEARYDPSRAGLLAVRCELHLRSVRLTLQMSIRGRGRVEEEEQEEQEEQEEEEED